MSNNKVVNQIDTITSDKTPIQDKTDASILLPTPSSNPQIQFSFVTLTGWTTYEYSEYKDLNLQVNIPDNGRITVDDKDRGCIFYAGSDDIGRGGPSNIYDNIKMEVGGIKFNRRTWYHKEGGLPFFRYYFPIEDYPITLYSWLTDQDCITHVDTIIDSFEFR